MPPESASPAQLAAIFTSSGADPSEAEHALLDYLDAVGAVLRRGDPWLPDDLAGRDDLLARAIAHVDPGAVRSALAEVAASRIAARDGELEANERWLDAALDAVELRESLERVSVALAEVAARARGDAARAIERFTDELSAVDAFASPQVGGLLVANPRRRELAAQVRAGAMPEAAWWLGPRIDCPDGVAAGRTLTTDESVHGAACEWCRDEQRRAALLDDLFDEQAGAHPTTAKHQQSCPECIARAEAMRDASAVGCALDEAEGFYRDLFARPLPEPRRREIEHHRDQPRAHVAEVTGTVDGRDCRGRVVVVPDGPVGPATELSLVVHDAPAKLRGRTVRIQWKDGGLMAEGTFQRDVEASLPLLPSVVEQFGGRSLPSALISMVLSFDVGRA